MLKISITSNIQKESVSSIAKGEVGKPIKPKSPKKAKTPKKIVPSLDISVKNRSPHGDCEFKCISKHRKFEVSAGKNLNELINGLVANH